MATALIKVFLPPYESNFSLHSCSFRQTFSLIFEKDFAFEWPSIYGNPRFHIHSCNPSTPHKSIITLLVSSYTFLLKLMDVSFFFNFLVRCFFINIPGLHNFLIFCHIRREYYYRQKAYGLYLVHLY